MSAFRVLRFKHFHTCPSPLPPPLSKPPSCPAQSCEDLILGFHMFSFTLSKLFSCSQQNNLWNAYWIVAHLCLECFSDFSLHFEQNLNSSPWKTVNLLPWSSAEALWASIHPVSIQPSVWLFVPAISLPGTVLPSLFTDKSFLFS